MLILMSHHGAWSFAMADIMVKSNLIALIVITHSLILFISIYCEYESKSYVANELD